MNSALGHADPTVANRTEREWEEVEAREYLSWISLLTDIPTNRLQCLDQTAWWSSRNGWIKIEEMEPSHRQNTANFLLRHAESLLFKWYLRYSGSGPYAEDIPFEDMSSEDWVKSTPLYLTLTEGNDE